MSVNVFVLVGLGNPGAQYHETRHNVGFMLLDRIAEEQGASGLWQGKFKADTNRVRLFDSEFILVKPQTFMNLSGDPVSKVLQFFKVPPERLIVVFDDLDQEPGAVRMRSGGGHGGHNGVRDILAKLGTETFHRIKIGIGKPEHKGQTAGWVLHRFSQAEFEHLKKESFPTALERLQGIVKALKAKG